MQTLCISKPGFNQDSNTSLTEFPDTHIITQRAPTWCHNTPVISGQAPKQCH